MIEHAEPGLAPAAGPLRPGAGHARPVEPRSYPRAAEAAQRPVAESLDVAAAYKNHFNSREYLEEYYATIGAENDQLLRFFATAYAAVPDGALLLELGGGPTLYQLVSAANAVAEIHFSDYLGQNLQEVVSWKDGLYDAFDWSAYFRRALEIELAARRPYWRSNCARACCAGS